MLFSLRAGSINFLNLSQLVSKTIHDLLILVIRRSHLLSVSFSGQLLIHDASEAKMAEVSKLNGVGKPRSGCGEVYLLNNSGDDLLDEPSDTSCVVALFVKFCVIKGRHEGPWPLLRVILNGITVRVVIRERSGDLEVSLRALRSWLFGG